MKRLLAIAILVASASLFVATGAVFAASTTSGGVPTVSYPTPNLEIKIPGVNFATPTLTEGQLSSNFIGIYVAGAYRYLLGFAMTIAIVMIMVGGTRYVLGGASSKEVSAAKKMMTQALEGFVLLVFVYVILYTINPETTLLRNIYVTVIAEVPLDTIIEDFDPDGTTATGTGAALYGVSNFQDCMLKKFGDAPSKVKTVSISFEYLGKKRVYKVNAAAAPSFQKAFDTITSSSVNYDITRDTAGNTISWRARRSDPNKLSNHSWATAIDINPDKNPYCPRGCFDKDASTSCGCLTSSDCKTLCESRKYDLPQEVIKAFMNNGFSWLGDQQTASDPNALQDYMHFDFRTGCE